MSTDGVERCIVDGINRYLFWQILMLHCPGKTARFIWNDGAPQVHNVNYLNQLNLTDPKNVYDTCNFNHKINTTKEDPNKEFTVTKYHNNPFQYFVCGIGDGAHCNRGVKARFHVVDGIEKCHIHHYGTCDDEET